MKVRTENRIGKQQMSRLRYLDKHTGDRRLRKITRKEEEKTLIEEGEKMSVFFMFTE